MYRQFNLSYDEWKLMRTHLGGNTYYIEEEFRYIPFLIDLTVQNIYRTEVMSDPSHTSSLVDFETTIKATATEVDTIDNGVAEEIV
jgi:hypothetical protein